MTDYFSDRQFGSNPRIEEKIDKVAWAGILSLIQIRIDDGSLAYGFPSHCPDGNAIDGTNVSAFAARVRAEIHDLAGEDPYSWPPPPDSLPSTLAILDFIEFIARNIGEPNQVGWHDFFSHHHLKLNREAGLKKFVEDINRIFSRNGLAYELSESGAIERTVPAPMADLVNRSSFRTGDSDLDGILDTAIDRFLSPKPEARQDALEKLWDAFERLKTIEAGKDKKARATALIDRATSDVAPVFRSVVETEFKAMTTAGNELHIRHPEVGQEPVGETGGEGLPVHAALCPGLVDVEKDEAAVGGREERCRLRGRSAVLNGRWRWLARKKNPHDPNRQQETHRSRDPAGGDQRRFGA